jgi:hypothetical protein
MIGFLLKFHFVIKLHFVIPTLLKRAKVQRTGGWDDGYMSKLGNAFLTGRGTIKRCSTNWLDPCAMTG